MFDTYNHGTDHFSVPLSFRKVVSANFCPEYLRTMQNFEPMSIIDFYFVANIRTVNDGNIVSMAGLNKIDSLVKIHRLIHDNYIVESTSESQIKNIK